MFSAIFNLLKPDGSSNLDGANGFSITGVAYGDYSGRSVANAHDVNADGIDDIVIGAPFANAGAGQSYVLFGNKTDFPATFELSTLNGWNGFTINGINFGKCIYYIGDDSGWSVSSAGDVNADGIDDIIIGAPYAISDGQTTGQSYIIFGQNYVVPSPTPTPSQPPVPDSSAGVVGEQLVG